MKTVALLMIRGYQESIGKLVPAGTCRFHPTCSVYGYESIDRHGIVRGSWLALSRLFRCHPFHPGGLDPVPPRSPAQSPVPLPENH